MLQRCRAPLHLRQSSLPLSQQTTHGAVQFTVYDELKHLAARWGAAPDGPDRKLGTGELPRTRMGHPHARLVF